MPKDVLTDSRTYHGTTTGQTDTGKDQASDGKGIKCATQTQDEGNLMSEASESSQSASMSSRPIIPSDIRISENQRTDSSCEDGILPSQLQDSEEENKEENGRTL